MANLDKPEALVATVRDLGDRHCRRTAPSGRITSRPSAALLWTPEHALGPDFTPEIRAAWSETHRVITDLMTMTGTAKAA
ncbi:globin domain-containing protein [Methylobacterium oryzae CBMB20]